MITRMSEAFFEKEAWWEDNKSSISLEIGKWLIEATAWFEIHYQYNEIDGMTESVDKVIDRAEKVTINAWYGEEEVEIDPDLVINELNGSF